MSGRLFVGTIQFWKINKNFIVMSEELFVQRDKRRKVVKITLNYIGMDSWDRPVYEDESGVLWKDISPLKKWPPELCTSIGNKFDGEPDTQMYYFKKYADVKVQFVPERIVWDA